MRLIGIAPARQILTVGKIVRPFPSLVNGISTSPIAAKTDSPVGRIPLGPTATQLCWCLPRTADPPTAPVQHVSADRRYADIPMAQPLLSRADIGAVFEEMGNEGMANIADWPGPAARHPRLLGLTRQRRTPRGPVRADDRRSGDRRPRLRGGSCCLVRDRVGHIGPERAGGELSRIEHGLARPLLPSNGHGVSRAHRLPTNQDDDHAKHLSQKARVSASADAGVRPPHMAE